MAFYTIFDLDHRFTIIPMAVIFRYALSSPQGGFTLENIMAIADPVHLKAVVFSLEIAIGCTLICILLSYPLVLALRRLNLGKRGFAMFILILPMWMNFILRVLAWQMILSNNGILNFLLQKIGLEPVALANSGAAIMIGVVMIICLIWCCRFLMQFQKSMKILLMRQKISAQADGLFSENYFSIIGSGIVERNRDGICAVHDIFCYLRYFRRRKTAVDR